PELCRSRRQHRAAGEDRRATDPGFARRGRRRMSGLADRIRGIVAPNAVSKPVASGFSRTSGPPEGGLPVGFETSDISQVLGGEWRETGPSTALGAGARCFIVERRMEPDTRHGRDTIGTLAEWMQQGTPDAVLFEGGGAGAAPVS